MRRHGQRPISLIRMLWTVVLLGLPQMAVAEGATGAPTAPVFPNSDPAVGRAGAPPTNPPSELDLRIDPGQLPSLRELPDGALEGDWADRAIGPYPYGMPGIEDDGTDGDAKRSAADRGLSFGLEVKPRTRMGSLARQHEEQDPGLEGQLERLLERPAFGVRGRYRF
jgi:hypothetical protein